MRTIVINAGRLEEKETAHAYMKRRLRSNEYYGNNLDALYDVLSALGEETCILVLHPKKAGAYTKKVIDTLQEAAQTNPNLEVKVLG